MRVSGQVMKLLFVAGAMLAGVLGLLPLPAGAVGPEPAPLAPPVQLTVGYQKVGHLAGAGVGQCCRPDGRRLVTEIRDWPKGCAVRFLG